jgi:hypothetical protein
MEPHILDLGTSWRWVVNFTPPPALPPGKSPLYPLNKRLGGPPVWTTWGRENSWLYRNSNCKHSVFHAVASRLVRYPDSWFYLINKETVHWRANNCGIIYVLDVKSSGASATILTKESEWLEAKNIKFYSIAASSVLGELWIPRPLLANFFFL